MTWKNFNDQTKHNFIIIHYLQRDFIIAQPQFLASAYLEEEYELKSVNPYFPSLVIVKNEVLLLFNFSNYVKDAFLCESHTNSRFLLISNNKKFSQEHWAILNRIKTKPAGIPISHQRFALRIESDVEFQALAGSELKALPAPLHNYYSQRGIMGLRFTGDTLQYVLDIETILMNALFKKEGRSA
jgi:hypothetical protein